LHLLNGAPRLAHHHAMRGNEQSRLGGEHAIKAFLHLPAHAAKAEVRQRKLTEATLQASHFPKLSRTENQIAREGDALAVELDEIRHRAVGVSRRFEHLELQSFP